MSKEKVVYIENTTSRPNRVKTYDKAAEVANFCFMPKMNIVPADVYEALRPNLKLHLKHKKLVEHFIEKKEGKDKDGKVTSKSFKDMTNDQIEKVISEMYDEKALEDLKAGQESEYIRLLIANQIDEIGKFKKKGKKQKED